MKATELRIGNHLIKDGVIVTIDSRSIFDIWDNEGVKKFAYSPIPLGERWMLQLGFKKIETYGSSNYWTKKVKEQFVSFYETEGTWKLENINHLTYIKYVHQLQNLFFALTGEELKL